MLLVVLVAMFVSSASEKRERDAFDACRSYLETRHGDDVSPIGFDDVEVAEVSEGVQVSGTVVISDRERDLVCVVDDSRGDRWRLVILEPEKFPGG